MSVLLINSTQLCSYYSSSNKINEFKIVIMYYMNVEIVREFVNWLEITQNTVIIHFYCNKLLFDLTVNENVMLLIYIVAEWLEIVLSSTLFWREIHFCCWIYRKPCVSQSKSIVSTNFNIKYE